MRDCLYIFGSLLTFSGLVGIYTSAFVSGTITLTLGSLILYCGFLTEGGD
mgnify:CR=1 FL=1